ncbi:MAG: CopG family transcriptional regulator [Acidobacteriota bacterium]
MVKTTVYLQADTALALRQLAKSRGQSQAELIREALRLFTRTASRPMPKGVGKYRSGRSDISARSEELIGEAIRERRGK